MHAPTMETMKLAKSTGRPFVALRTSIDGFCRLDQLNQRSPSYFRQFGLGGESERRSRLRVEFRIDMSALYRYLGVARAVRSERGR